MTTMAKVPAVAVIGASLLGAIVVDYLTPWPYVTTPLYAIPVLLAACWLAPREVGVAAVLGVTANVASIVLQAPPLFYGVFDALGLIVIAYLAVLLTAERVRLARRTREVEVAEWRVQEVEALLEASKQIARSLDLTPTLDGILENVVRLGEADFATVLLLEPDGELTSRAAYGRGAERFEASRYRLGEGLPGIAAQAGKTINITDASQEVRWANPEAVRAAGVGSALFLPLHCGERVTGVLSAASRERGHFSPRHERLLAGLADQAALAIEHAREVAERKRAEEEQSRLLAQHEEALTKVKLLSGLLPICASCKKIRDDNGHWNHIESYIRDRSEADFTHGICPECAKKLYGDLISDDA